jgi:hypothetical protein
VRLVLFDPNLPHEVVLDELGDESLGGSAFEIVREGNEAIIALRCRREDNQLLVGEFRHGAILPRL